jgi:hypothetical protein
MISRRSCVIVIVLKITTECLLVSKKKVINDIAQTMQGMSFGQSYVAYLVIRKKTSKKHEEKEEKEERLT